MSSYGRSLYSQVLAVHSFIVIAAAFGFLLGCRSSSAIAGARHFFAASSSLQPRVRFWLRVFGEYSQRDVLIHDRAQVWKVYEVVHLPGSGPPALSDVVGASSYLAAKYRRALSWLAEGKEPINATERRVAELFGDAPRAAYARAARNLTVRQGLREVFRRGLERSARYRPMMERIFERFELPQELVVLAAVESEFNPRARSAAGAVGIWQFIRSTGRDYDLVGSRRDYRYDPRRSTEAAARLLRANYQRLHSWPLAITAYDYGAGAMAGAARTYGGDYLRILRENDDPNFGFAVKNYYSEFLAALEIYRDPGHYFSELESPRTRPPTLMARSYKVRRGDTLAAIARHCGVSLARLIKRNRIRNPRRLRTGQVLALPSGGHPLYASARRHRYKVRRGDTLYALARRAGASVRTLIKINRIEHPRSLPVGRVIYVPDAQLTSR